VSSGPSGATFRWSSCFGAAAARVGFAQAERALACKVGLRGATCVPVFLSHVALM